MSTLKKLQNYMGKRKVLLPAAMLLSALSALAGMLPYILIWLIVRELLEHGEITSSGNVVTYAWWAAGMAVASIVLYFAALMSSHLAAFRVESNLRKEAMRQIVRMPLGFFDINTSGRIRKIIDDNAGVTHSFLAHQLPDLAATFLVPLVAYCASAVGCCHTDFCVRLDTRSGMYRPCNYCHAGYGFYDECGGTAVYEKLHDLSGGNEYRSCRVCERNSRSEGFPADYLLFQKLSPLYHEL